MIFGTVRRRGTAMILLLNVTRKVRHSSLKLLLVLLRLPRFKRVSICAAIHKQRCFEMRLLI